MSVEEEVVGEEEEEELFYESLDRILSSSGSSTSASDDDGDHPRRRRGYDAGGGRGRGARPVDLRAGAHPGATAAAAPADGPPVTRRSRDSRGADRLHATPWARCRPRRLRGPDRAAPRRHPPRNPRSEEAACAEPRPMCQMPRWRLLRRTQGA